MKRLLLSLFISLIGLISFCSASTVKTLTFDGNSFSNNTGFIDIPISSYFFTTSIPKSEWNCEIVVDFGNCRCRVQRRYNYSYVYNYCTDVSTCQGNYEITKSSGTCTGFSFTMFEGLPSECPTCPSQYTSEECQSVYDLVPSSNLSTCETSLSDCQISLSGWNNTLNNCSNNLLSCQSSLSSCIQSNCPFDTGDVQWSALYINNIQHLSSPIINIDIPENINWDYTITGDTFDLYIGSGYDVEYIESIIDINSYRPTTEDFTGVFVSGLTLIMPYIIFVLFLVFMRKLIKRIFK